VSVLGKCLLFLKKKKQEDFYPFGSVTHFFKLSWVGLALCLYFLSCTQLLAQRLVIDRTSLQAVGLFEHSCLEFAGFAGNLRTWADAHHLFELPPERAATFLMRASGKVYDASTPDGRLMLASRDNGTCMILMLHGDKDGVDAALHAMFRTRDFIVTRVSDKTSTDGGTKQTMDLVQMGKRALHVSTTSGVRSEPTTSLPVVVITATATP
jgi:hypothetical protein